MADIRDAISEEVMEENGEGFSSDDDDDDDYYDDDYEDDAFIEIDDSASIYGFRYAYDKYHGSSIYIGGYNREGRFDYDGICQWIDKLTEEEAESINDLTLYLDKEYMLMTELIRSNQMKLFRLLETLYTKLATGLRFVDVIIDTTNRFMKYLYPILTGSSSAIRNFKKYSKLVINFSQRESETVYFDCLDRTRLQLATTLYADLIENGSKFVEQYCSNNCDILSSSSSSSSSSFKDNICDIQFDGGFLLDQSDFVYNKTRQFISECSNLTKLELANFRTHQDLIHIIRLIYCIDHDGYVVAAAAPAAAATAAGDEDGNASESSAPISEIALKLDMTAASSANNNTFDQIVYVKQLLVALGCCNRGILQKIVLDITWSKPDDRITNQSLFEEHLRIPLRQMLMNNYCVTDFQDEWLQSYENGGTFCICPDLLNEEMHPLRRFQSLIDIYGDQFKAPMLELWIDQLFRLASSDRLTRYYQNLIHHFNNLYEYIRAHVTTLNHARNNVYVIGDVKWGNYHATSTIQHAPTRLHMYYYYSFMGNRHPLPSNRTSITRQHMYYYYF